MPRQFVIQLDNHPHELAHLAHAFAARGIAIQHVGCVGAGPLACMFVTTDVEDEAAARHVVQGLGHPFIEGSPIVVEVSDGPEGLAKVSERLAAAGVRITGTLPAGCRPGVLEMTLCVDDEPAARRALGIEHGELVAV